MAANLYKPRPTTSMLRAPGSDANNSPPNTRAMQPGSVVMGRYTIQKVIGRGGMATVYLAKNQETERLVALKILDPEISNDPSYVERFRREARAAGRIRSDHVVAIYDLGTDEYGTLVLVMEYLEGQTVQQALRNGRMPLQRGFILGRQLCEGLAAAHENGVIHRDLKPANLFVERLTGGTEKLKILDFGISKLAEASSQELTRAGQTLGTLAYMAPEQIRGAVKGNDPRIDLYSAGVSLFLMFTAKRPIDADDTVQLLQAVLEKPPLTLSQAAGVEFPPALEAFVARCLVKDPTRRYQSALEMRDALLQAAQDSRIDAIGHFSTPNVAPAAPVAPRASAPSFESLGPGASTVMEAAPSFTPPSGVIVSNVEPSGPAPSLTLPTFDDEEEEGKTVVRGQNAPTQAPPSTPLPLAGRRPTGVGMPIAQSTSAAPAGPMRAPTMAPSGPPSMAQPTLPPQRSATLLGMPEAPPPPASEGFGSPSLGESPPTQAVDVFGAQPAFPPPPPQVAGFAPQPTMPPPSFVSEAPAPPKRSSMKFVLVGASLLSLLIVSVAGYVAVSRPRAANGAGSTQATLHAQPSTQQAAAQPQSAAPPQPSVEPQPVAQTLSPTPAPPAAAPTPPTPAEPAAAEPTAPDTVAQAAPNAQPAPAAPTPSEANTAPQPPAPTQAAAPVEPAPTAATAAADNANDDHPRRGAHRVRREPTTQASDAPTTPRPVARPVQQPAEPQPPRRQRPPRTPRGPITAMPF